MILTFLLAFLFAGALCLIAQIIYDNTRLTPGHITSIYVVAGVLLYSFGIYEKLIEIFGGGAMTPITNFGYLLAKSAVEGAAKNGVLGILTEMLIPVSAVIVFTVVIACLTSLFVKPKP